MLAKPRYLWLVALVAAFIGGAVLGWAVKPTPEPPQAAESREVTARTFTVERIIDGDTFKIVYDGEPTSVRLFGIDAPERKEPGGPEATAALKELIGGKTVRVEFPAKRKRDNLGRLLCRVYIGDVDVGAEMMRRGCAVPHLP